MYSFAMSQRFCCWPCEAAWGFHPLLRSGGLGNTTSRLYLPSERGCQGEDEEEAKWSEGAFQGYLVSFKGEQSCLNTWVRCWLLGLENCPFGCWGSSLNCCATWLWRECKGISSPSGSRITSHARHVAPYCTPWMNKLLLIKNQRC